MNSPSARLPFRRRPCRWLGVVAALPLSLGWASQEPPRRDDPVPVEVRTELGATDSFRTGILPVLTRAGCNAGSCHGAATGQGGFRLSLLGYDPEEDHDRLTRELGGRRIDRVQPERSLLLRKASGDLDHEGGRRLGVDSEGYRRLAAWIKEGARRGDPGLVVTGLVVEPSDITLPAPGAEVRLQVTALRSDGVAEEVSRWALYRSNDDAVAEVDRDGRVTVRGAGLSSVMVRYGGQVAVARLAVPWGPPQTGVDVAADNPVDREVDRVLARLGIRASGPSNATTFLRRAHLDLLGRLPEPEVTRAFLAGPDTPARREEVLDALLERPEFTDYWSLWLADWLRVGGRKGSAAVASRWRSWLKEQVSLRVPMDRVVVAMLTAVGDPTTEGPVGFMLLASDPRDLAETASAILLGTRIACARCHAHPADRWTQEDYHQFAAFFARIRREAGVVGVAERGEVEHPKTGRAVAPRPLGGEGSPRPDDGEDRRLALAGWVTAPGNPFFARAFVNRVWRRLLGRGLVEPVDDLRPTNPSTHPELLDGLAAEFERSGYDLRALVRRVVRSRTYQRGPADPSSEGLSPPAALASRFYAAASPRPLSAEVLLDAIAEVTGVAESFPGLPEGTRAVQLAGPVVASPALDVLGRCPRDRGCEAADSVGGGLAQALHLIQGSSVQGRLRSGRVAAWADGTVPPGRMVEELWLRAFARPPREEERTYWSETLATAPEAREAIEDLVWVVLNSGEFAFNH